MLLLFLVVAIAIELNRCNPDYLNIVSVIIATILTVVALYFAYQEYKRNTLKDRIREYKSSNDGIKNNFTMITSGLNGDYIKDVEKGTVASDEIYLPIVRKKGWVYPFECNIAWEVDTNGAKKKLILIPTSDIVINDRNSFLIKKIKNDNKDYAAIKEATRNYFPYKNEDVTGNLERLDDKFYSSQAPTFGLAGEPRIKNDGKIHLTVNEGTYSMFVNTCFGYKYSAWKNYSHKEEMNDTDSNHECKDTFRETFPYCDYKNRFVKIGIITLLVLLNVKEDTGGTSDYFLIHDRDGDVIEAAGQISVIPEGTFQPPIDLKERCDIYRGRYFDDPIAYNVAREFAEELFGKNESQTLSNLEVLDDEYNLLKKHCYYLGIGFNPLEGHAELITIASIDMGDDASEAKKFFAWEKDDEEVKSAIKEDKFLTVLNNMSPPNENTEPNRKSQEPLLTPKACEITKQSIEKRIKVSSESKKVSLEKFTYKKMVEYSNREDVTPGLQMIVEVLTGKTICVREKTGEEVFDEIYISLGGTKKDQTKEDCENNSESSCESQHAAANNDVSTTDDAK
jgi:hypothetical protein